MKNVTLYPVQHHGNECIFIGFAYDAALQAAVQNIKGVQWSQTHRCWWLPLDEYHVGLLTKACEGKADMDGVLISDYLLIKQRSPKLARLLLSSAPASGLYSEISESNFAALLKMEQHLILKAYSESTIRTYLNELQIFMKAIKQHPAESFHTDRIKDYLQYCLDKLKLSENTVHSRMNALKFFYEQVLGREKFFLEIPRPKKAVQLPRLLNQDEIASIINATSNRKHKAMLMLAYGAGLRVSEITALKTCDIDSRRMTLAIRGAKGKKDRFVPLSPVLLVMLREYAKEYKPGQKGYLFEGAEKGMSYSTRSVQEVLQTAKRKCNIMKPGGVHSLRHSFATHLIEKGTDVTMIQKILGHNNIKTTLIYLHTSNRDLLKIISPLDDLDLT